MFERFTEQARQVVVSAQREARGSGDGFIRQEHLLLGLLDQEDGLAARLLADAGIERAEVRITSEADALASIGIDLDAVRGRVEAAFGPGALDRCRDGSVPFRPETKKALELAVREAKSLHHDHIGTEHLLLALARDAHPLLAAHGLSHERVLELVRS